MSGRQPPVSAEPSTLRPAASATRALRRIAFGLLCLATIAVAGVVGVLAWPQTLHAHSASHGRLSLHSDAPFDTEAGISLLADVERRIAAAPVELRAADVTWHIVISNTEWRRRLTFLDKYGAGGVNYHLLPRTAFLRPADILRNRLIGNDGRDVQPPRTLAYFAAHEIAHGMVTARIGALARLRLPVWIEEGLADYVAFAGEMDLDQLARGFREGRPELDPAATGLYGRYHLLVAHFLDTENWNVDDLLTSAMPQEDAERRFKAHQR